MTIEIKAEGHLLLNGRHIYYSRFTQRANALAFARASIKTWVATHPAIHGFLLVRPVDAGRLEQHGGAILPYWRDS